MQVAVDIVVVRRTPLLLLLPMTVATVGVMLVVLLRWWHERDAIERIDPSQGCRCSSDIF
jgi:hypothetical protein